jgi:hypothetical protein
VVRPRSCRVIYYFDTPALGRRHQSFGRVNISWNYGWKLCENKEEVMLDEKMGKVAKG